MNENRGGAAHDTSPASPDAETLLTAIRNFPIVIFRQDRDLRYEWIFNSALGFRAEDVIGKTDRDLLESAEDAENLETLKREVLDTGVVRRQEVHIGRGAVTRYYDLVINPSAGPNGRIDGVTCAATDVTDRRLAELARHEAEERLRLAIESARIGTWLYEVATDTLSLSDRCREIFGVAPDAAFAYERLLELLHPEDREMTRRDAEGAFLGENGGLHAGEHRLLLPDGRTTWVIERAHAFFDDAQQPVRFIGTVFDITGQKLNELALVDAVRLRDETLAIVSHDLRAPLATIVLAMNLQLMDDARPEKRVHVELALEAARRMESLIRDLLDVARIKGGHFIVEPVALPAAVLLAEAATMTRQLANERGLTLQYAASELPNVLADRDRIHRVFTNLVANAVKFTPPGGTISIGAREVDDAAEFSVGDTGEGIEPAMLPLVFDAWSQGTTGRRFGAGLGLAIVKGIVQAHGGSVAIESERGRGTTVRFRLPAAGN